MTEFGEEKPKRAGHARPLQISKMQIEILGAFGEEAADGEVEPKKAA
jgi:hypothetical protein